MQVNKAAYKTVTADLVWQQKLQELVGSPLLSFSAASRYGHGPCQHSAWLPIAKVCITRFIAPLFSQIMSQRLQDHTLVDAFELYRHIARSRSGWLSSRLVCVNEYDMGDFGRSLLVDWESQQLLVSVGSTQLKVRVLEESAAVRQCRPAKLGCSV